MIARVVQLWRRCDRHVLLHHPAIWRWRLHDFALVFLVVLSGMVSAGWLHGVTPDSVVHPIEHFFGVVSAAAFAAFFWVTILGIRLQRLPQTIGSAGWVAPLIGAAGMLAIMATPFGFFAVLDSKIATVVDDGTFRSDSAAVERLGLPIRFRPPLISYRWLQRGRMLGNVDRRLTHLQGVNEAELAAGVRALKRYSGISEPVLRSLMLQWATELRVLAAVDTQMRSLGYRRDRMMGSQSASLRGFVWAREGLLVPLDSTMRLFETFLLCRGTGEACGMATPPMIADAEGLLDDPMYWVAFRRRLTATTLVDIFRYGGADTSVATNAELLRLARRWADNSNTYGNLKQLIGFQAQQRIVLIGGRKAGYSTAFPLVPSLIACLVVVAVAFLMTMVAQLGASGSGAPVAGAFAGILALPGAAAALYDLVQSRFAQDVSAPFVFTCVGLAYAFGLACLVRTMRTKRKTVNAEVLAIVALLLTPLLGFAAALVATDFSWPELREWIPFAAFSIGVAVAMSRPLQRLIAEFRALPS